MTEQLSPAEEVMFRGDVDPRMRSSVSAIYLLDAPPDWDRFRDMWARAAATVPRLRQRVVLPALPITPAVWADDHDFDLDHHLHRVRLPEPGTHRALLDLAQVEAARGFDRGRPLWNATLVEGLPGGRAAVIQVGHHAVADGVGGMQLAATIFGVEPGATVDEVASPMVPAPADVVTPLDLVRDALAPGEMLHRGGRLGRRLVDALRSPQQVVASSRRTLEAVAHMRSVPSPDVEPAIGRERSARWHFGALEFPFDALRSAAKAAGGSVNDAYLAGIAGGLRHLTDAYDVEGPLGDIAVGVPVNRRTDDDPVGGNQWSGTVVALPVGDADPASRISTIGRRMGDARRHADVDMIGVMAPVLKWIPASLAGILSENTAGPIIQASNIPGSPVPLYIAGAKMERLYPFGPLPGVAAMITMNTHAGTACIGLNLDAAATDPEQVELALVAGFAEVLDLGDGGEVVRFEDLT